MPQVNFILIFVICLAVILFGLENTQPVSIKIIEGLEFRAPLCVELLVTLGIGAVMAWIFSVWVDLQNNLTQQAAVKDKEVEITTLQDDIEHYKAELEKQQRLLPGVSSATNE